MGMFTIMSMHIAQEHEFACIITNSHHFGGLVNRPLDL